ncbi:MAG: flavin reductase [Christensenellaceae bacterium]|jgi:flavin reductase (DIM6/NTAB) family NADH-FMN oxidoreductase RutF|nr:flavin reductase [Christensenellaceae bacterium]
MENFIEIAASAFSFNPFVTLGKEWMLITAEKEGKANTMTAAWGGFGVVWGKNAATVYIRPQRYTNEFVSAAERFSLGFFGPGFREEMNLLGSASGRDGDKIAKAGFTVAREGGVPYIEQAQTVIFCKKLYAQQIELPLFTVPGFGEKMYPENDPHIAYVGEIEGIWKKG